MINKVTSIKKRQPSLRSLIIVELNAKFSDKGHVEGIESAVLISAVPFSSTKHEKISFELAARQAQLVGGHVWFMSEHGDDVE